MPPEPCAPELLDNRSRRQSNRALSPVAGSGLREEKELAEKAIRPDWNETAGSVLASKPPIHQKKFWVCSNGVAARD